MDLRPTMPLWCALSTRVVKPKSAEARCEGAAKALKKELSNMESKNGWDTDEVILCETCSIILTFRRRCLEEFYPSWE